VDETTGSLLVVDDEENILAALRRTLRREPYTVLVANSGAEGLRILAERHVDVVVSDQRMPGMSGTDFLRSVKKAYPHTVRMVLSGYTELKSVTDAINEGAIYKFLTKPWDDDHLRANIAEAFRHKALADENRRLAHELALSNEQLACANESLKAHLAVTEHELLIDGAALEVAREVVEALPLPVVGVDMDRLVVFANAEAERVLGAGGPLLGMAYYEVLSSELQSLLGGGGTQVRSVRIGGQGFVARASEMGRDSRSIGRLLVLLPETSHAAR